MRSIRLMNQDVSYWDPYPPNWIILIRFLFIAILLSIVVWMYFTSIVDHLVLFCLIGTELYKSLSKPELKIKDELKRRKDRAWKILLVGLVIFFSFWYLVGEKLLHDWYWK